MFISLVYKKFHTKKSTISNLPLHNLFCLSMLQQVLVFVYRKSLSWDIDDNNKQA